MRSSLADRWLVSLRPESELDVIGLTRTTDLLFSLTLNIVLFENGSLLYIHTHIYIYIYFQSSLEFNQFVDSMINQVLFEIIYFILCTLSFVQADLFLLVISINVLFFSSSSRFSQNSEISQYFRTSIVQIIQFFRYRYILFFFPSLWKRNW